MKYYTVRDVMEITGASQNLSYEIIRKLRKSFQKKYPESISLQGKIPKWYFDETMMFEKREEKVEQ